MLGQLRIKYAEKAKEGWRWLHQQAQGPRLDSPVPKWGRGAAMAVLTPNPKMGGVEAGGPLGLTRQPCWWAPGSLADPACL